MSMKEIHARPGAYRINLSKREREYVQDLLERAVGTVEDDMLNSTSDREVQELQRNRRIAIRVLNKVDESRYGSGLDEYDE